MTRVNIEGSLLRNTIQEGSQLFKSEVLAIAANLTLIIGMPYAIMLDPASTGRNVTMYTPAVTALLVKHEIWNISTGTGALSLLQADGTTAIGSLAPGQKATMLWNPKTQLWQAYVDTAAGTNTVASQQVLQQYTTLALLTNTDVIAMAVPFKFTLNSVGFRIRRPATTAAKLATLTAQVNGVSVTGGVVSLTSANATPTNALVAGTTITAGGAGAAGNTIGVLVSAVTAFVEGDGYIEYNVTNLSESV